LLTKASSNSAIKASLVDNEEAVTRQLGEPITADLLRCKVEGSELVPTVWLLKKHVCGDGRAGLVVCCGWAKIRVGDWEGSWWSLGWEVVSVGEWKREEMRKLGWWIGSDRE
jgi:hypothetical protein